MSPSRRPQRGYTIAELLSVVFILALIMSLVALIIGPIMRSQSQTQAKVDTVQAADTALYRLERDLRNTDINQIYSCTISASPVCSAPATTLTNTAAIVLASAYKSGTGPFQLVTLTGQPAWQGATVYWVDSVGNINVKFDTPASYSGGTLKDTDAENAVKDVTASGGMRLARFVEQLSLAVPNIGHKVSLQMQAKSTVNGTVNETTYTTDLQTRN